MKINRFLLSILCCFLLNAALFQGVARAGSNEWTPFASLKEEYTDNLFLSATDEVDDFISTLSAGLRYRFQDQRSDAGASVRLDSLYYNKETELDAVDQRYSGHLSHQLTDRLGCKVSGSYVKDSRPDRDIDVSGLVLNTDIRQRQEYSLSAQYAMTPVTMGTCGFSFSRDAYDDSESSDVDTQGASFSISHDMSKWAASTTGIVFTSLTRYAYDIVDIDSWSVTVGFIRRITELWQLEVSLGGRLTRSAYDVVYYEDSEETGTVGAISLGYRGEYTQYGLRASRDISTAGNETGVTERTSLTANYQYRFARELVALFSAGYYLNQADRNSLSTRDIDETTVSVHPGLRWEITRDLKLDVYYTYTALEDSANDTSAGRNRAFIELGYQFPI
ncbi:MAG: outer membrane beta-barrel protein [Pseudomonadota bacterium]